MHGVKVLTPQVFAEKWAGAALSERASYQQHFLDLCAMLGAPGPAEADAKGEFYAFEKGVEKTGGGKGFADVWYEGRFAFEYKGRHKNLNAAYVQLLQYREPLGNPPLLVVTDTQRYEVHTNFTGTVKHVYRFTNAELARPENVRVLRALFEDPDALRPSRTVEGVSSGLPPGVYGQPVRNVFAQMTPEQRVRLGQRQDPDRLARATAFV